MPLSLGQWESRRYVAQCRHGSAVAVKLATRPAAPHCHTRSPTAAYNATVPLPWCKSHAMRERVVTSGVTAWLLCTQQPPATKQHKSTQKQCKQCSTPLLRSVCFLACTWQEWRPLGVRQGVVPRWTTPQSMLGRLGMGKVRLVGSCCALHTLLFHMISLYPHTPRPAAFSEDARDQDVLRPCVHNAIWEHADTEMGASSWRLRACVFVLLLHRSTLTPAILGVCCV